MSAAAHIGIVGAGAWGTALAQMVASDGSAVTLWAYEEDVAASIAATRSNPSYLPGIRLAETISPTNDLGTLAGCSHVLMVTPAQQLARVLARLPDRGQPLILCSKGMEQGSGRLMAEVAGDAGWSGPVAVLSGPTFAHELAAGLPAAVTLAAVDRVVAEALSLLLARPFFRPYASDDVIGAEIGGVVKNVLAIACGVVDGARLGQNARAALISRGFAEMVRYGMVRGARIETLSGLAGLGDLVLTCSSPSSRNFALGREIGAGGNARELLDGRITIAEGAYSAAQLADDADGRGVDMPICRAVAQLIAGEKHAGEVIGELLNRPLTSEGWTRHG